jgi:hypothetical protein
MQVTDVFERKERREGGLNRLFQHTYKRYFQVETDNPAVGARAVREALPIGIGNTYDTGHEIDKFSFCEDIKVKCRDGDNDDGCTWDCELLYGPYDAIQRPENPLLAPIKTNWDAIQFETIVDRDINGNAVVNTAGDYFDPPVTRDDNRPLLVIVRNEGSYDPDLAGLYRDAINQDIFLNRFAPLTVKCKAIKPQHILDPFIGWYWEVTYEFEIKRDTWIKEILSQGMRQLKEDRSGWEVITDKGGPISAPVPLDENGRKLDPSADPVFMEYHIYNELSFSVFNFPPLPL